MRFATIRGAARTAVALAALAPLRPALAASGHVVDPDGKPVSGARACLLVAGAEGLCAVTDEAGFYGLPDSTVPWVRITAKGFLVRHLMADTTEHWLDTALVGGHVVNGHAVVSGDLDNWPFTHQDGLFRADADLQGAVLQFSPWNIRVNSIHPGQIADPGFFQSGGEAFARAAEAVIPLHRQGTPKECADLVLFLASDEASFITGVTLPVDGGASVRRG